MFIVDIVVMLIIVSISAIVNVWFLSQIVCSIIYGIPNTIKLKRRKILNSKASIFSFLFTIIFNGLLCFGLYKLLKGNISEKWFTAYTAGILMAFFYSFSDLSKKNRMLSVQDIMHAQRYNYGDIIMDLLNLSYDTTNNILDEIGNSVFVADIQKNGCTNISMMYCFSLGIQFYYKNGYIDEEDKIYIIAGLLTKLSEITNTNYNLLNHWMDYIMLCNKNYFNFVINEDMRMEYAYNFLKKMAPNSDERYLVNDENIIHDKYIKITNYLFGIILGNDVYEVDDKKITLNTSSSAIKSILHDADKKKKEKVKQQKSEKKVKKKKVIKEDDFFKEEFEFSYAKLKKVLKKVGFDSYLSFKESVYESKKIKRKNLKIKKKK